jgi:myo-inositol-1(or 4)-monophosphatase
MKQTLIECLKLGGETLMGYFGKIESIRVKESQSSIVTQADLESERRVVDCILRNFPDHNVIAEETGFRWNGSEYTWVVDPLDGTSNFAAGIPWFGVLVAVLRNFEPVVAGMYLPFYDQLYLAAQGEGATRNGQPVRVSSESSLKNVLLAYSLDYSIDPNKTAAETRIMGELVRNVRNLRSTNSAVDFCYVADGRLGGCANQTTGLWDIAAPWLIIREAGGVCTDIRGEALDFRVDATSYGRNFTIIAANPVLHNEIKQLVAPHLP